MRGITTSSILGLAVFLIPYCSGASVLRRSDLLECPTVQAVQSAKFDSKQLLGRFPRMDTARCGVKCNNNPNCQSFVSDELTEDGPITCVLFKTTPDGIFEDKGTSVTAFGGGKGVNVAGKGSSDVEAAINPAKMSSLQASIIPNMLTSMLTAKVPGSVLRKRRPFLWWPDKKEPKAEAERTILIFPMVTDYCTNGLEAPKLPCIRTNCG